MRLRFRFGFVRDARNAALRRFLGSADRSVHWPLIVPDGARRIPSGAYYYYIVTPKAARASKERSLPTQNSGLTEFVDPLSPR